MSAKLQLSVGVLTLSVMIATSLIGMYFIKTGKDSIDYSIDQSIKVHDMMIKEIQEIRDKGNIRANLTLQNFEQSEKSRQDEFNKTLETQLAIEKNILGNLTAHRHVTNFTRDQLMDFINDRNLAFNNTLQKLDSIATLNNEILNRTDTLTSDEFNKAADNKVLNVIGNISEEHELIFKALNITKTETPSEEKQLEQLLKDFVKGHKEKIPNEPKRPQVK